MNKRSLVFIALLLVGSIKVLSQQKSMISLSIGASQPIGSFAQKDSSSVLYLLNSNQIHTNAGFAKTGVNIALDYRYAINIKWGLLLKIKGQQNTCNSSALTNFYTQSSNDSWANQKNVTIGKWLSGSVLAGGYYTLFSTGVKHKIDVQANAMGGILKSSVPSSWVAFLNTSTYQAGVNSSPKRDMNIGFCYLIGADLFYHFNKSIDFIGSIDYSGAFLKESYFQIIPTGSSIPSYTSKPYIVKFNPSTLNINVGIGIEF